MSAECDDVPCMLMEFFPDVIITALLDTLMQRKLGLDVSIDMFISAGAMMLVVKACRCMVKPLIPVQTLRWTSHLRSQATTGLAVLVDTVDPTLPTRKW